MVLKMVLVDIFMFFFQRNLIFLFLQLVPIIKS